MIEYIITVKPEKDKLWTELDDIYIEQKIEEFEKQLQKFLYNQVKITIRKK